MDSFLIRWFSIVIWSHWSILSLADFGSSSNELKDLKSNSVLLKANSVATLLVDVSLVSSTSDSWNLMSSNFIAFSGGGVFVWCFFWTNLSVESEELKFDSSFTEGTEFLLVLG